LQRWLCGHALYRGGRRALFVLGCRGPAESGMCGAPRHCIPRSDLGLPLTMAAPM